MKKMKPKSADQIALETLQAQLAAAIREKAPWSQIQSLASELPSLDMDLGGSVSAAALAMHYDFDTFKKLLDMGVQLDKPNGSGYTLLHRACELDMAKPARELLSRGADPFKKTCEQALVASYSSNSLEICLRRRASGCLPEMARLFDKKQLHEALMSNSRSFRGCPENAKALIEAGAPIESKGQSALVDAAANGHKALALVLIEAGADCSFENSTGQTALGAWTSRLGSEDSELAERLLAAGADPNRRSKGHDPAAAAAAEPLLFCIAKESVKTAALLIGAGARFTPAMIKMAQTASKKNGSTGGIHSLILSAYERKELLEDEAKSSRKPARKARNAKPRL